LSNPTLKLRVISGWGVAPTILQDWLQLMPARFEVELVDIPDLAKGALLPAAQRAQQLLAGQPKDAYWLGWSLGGLLALDLAAHEPESVRGVITLASNPCFVAQPDWPGMDTELFQNFLNAYREMPAKTLQRFAALQINGAHDPRGQLRELKRQLLEPAPVLAELLELLAVDRRDWVQNSNLGLLCLFATADALVPAAVAQKMAALNPQLRAELICGASHLLFQDKPEVLLESVVNWIEQQESDYAR